MDLSEVSIIKLLPPNLAKDKNVRVMCEAFDEELRRVIAGIPDIAIIPNIVLKQITNNLLLDLLAWQFHCDFYETNFPVEKKQEIILRSLDWHTRKGTPSAVEEIVSTVLSETKILEWHEYGGLPYRFRVLTEDPLLDTESVKRLRRVINSVKNTRSFLDRIIQLINFVDDLPPLGEADAKIVHKDDVDGGIFRRTGLLHNGRISRDGQTRYGAVSRDYLWMKYLIGDFGAGYYLHDGTITRNGSKTRGPYMVPGFPDTMTAFSDQLVTASGFGFADTLASDFSEDVAMEMTIHRRHNGRYTRDGTITRNGSGLINL